MKIVAALSTSDLPFTDVEKVKENRAKKLDEGSKVIQIIAAQTTCEIWGTIELHSVSKNVPKYLKLFLCVIAFRVCMT